MTNGKHEAYSTVAHTNTYIHIRTHKNNIILKVAVPNASFSLQQIQWEERSEPSAAHPKQQGNLEFGVSLMAQLFGRIAITCVRWVCAWPNVCLMRVDSSGATSILEPSGRCSRMRSLRQVVFHRAIATQTDEICASLSVLQVVFPYSDKHNIIRWFSVYVFK